MLTDDNIVLVAAYCRVSTDKEDQVNSLESQKRYFSEYIRRNSMWKLTEVYADEGVSGTSTKKRHAFNRMIEDATEHRFNLIITKEISRFARNTLDSIFYTRKLKDLGIGVFFMNDNINTLDADAELRLTIMSSIAQEESRKTSERVKWGQRRSMEQGVVFGRDMLGYDVRNGRLYINEAGADTVRLIYHKFVHEKKGTHVIARELREEGVPTATYMKQWSNTVILRVLRNEKYCGDLIQKKTYTPSYLSHEKKYNRGEEDFITIQNHHEPIICRALFNQAQEELKRRTPSKEKKAKYSNRYCFSGKIKCGTCGSSYVSRSRKRKDLSIYHTWCCLENTKNGRCHIDRIGNEVGCSNRLLTDETLKLILMQIIKSLKIDRKSITQRLLRIIKGSGNITELSRENKTKMKEQIDACVQKKKSLIELFLNEEITKNDFQQLAAQYDSQISALENEALQMKSANDKTKNRDIWLQEIESKIQSLINGEQWDDTFYRNILNHIIIYENNTLDITLNLFPNERNLFTVKYSL